MDINIAKIAEQAKAIVMHTAAYVQNERAKWSWDDVKYKSDKSLVTSLDVASEQMLVRGLSKILPEADFLAEELHHDQKSKKLFWIIDPIDGTTNFAHGFPMYCISLALWQEDRIVLGIIYEMTSKECFWAHEGREGAYLNEIEMNVSSVKTVKESVIATGFPSSAFEHIDKYVSQFRTFMTTTQGLRRLGSAAMDLAYVAAGRCDGFFEYELKPWDVAAGAYLVQKAGGMVTDFEGGDNFIFGKQILASNNHIHDEFIEHFK
jgi:myo-inositol-1(or 4)-monophosphatase